MDTELDYAEARPASRKRRSLVILLSTVVLVVTCGVAGLGLIEGSWWYSDPTDNILNADDYARLDAVRTELLSSGQAPEVIVWLELAAERGADPSSVRAYLVEARQYLEGSGDNRLGELAQELQLVIFAIDGQSTLTTGLSLTPSP